MLLYVFKSNIKTILKFQRKCMVLFILQVKLSIALYNPIRAITFAFIYLLLVFFCFFVKLQVICSF